jgi:hypothetical protein
MFTATKINRTFDAQAQPRFPGTFKSVKKAAGPKAARLLEFDYKV